MPEPKELRIKREHTIPVPNLANRDRFGEWLNQNITTPPAGYEAKTHPDGSSFNVAEQVDAYRKQIAEAAYFMKEHKKEPLENILKMLMDIARDNIREDQ